MFVLHSTIEWIPNVEVKQQIQGGTEDATNIFKNKKQIMKNLIIILIACVTLSNCKKEETPQKQFGTIVLHQMSQTRSYFYQIDGGNVETIRFHNGQGLDCSTTNATVLKLEVGSHEITISNSGGCSNASGFTQNVFVAANSCLVSKISCGSTEL